MPSYGTSGLYKIDECCTWEHPDGTTHVHRNKQDNNQYPPLTLNVENWWEDLGEVTALIRAHYMDVVTRLYSENFCYQLGNWCREHGVMYI
jgi:hypothetical protein